MVHFLGLASYAAHRAAKFLDKLLEPPKRKDALKINKYTNTKFTLLTIERSFFEEFEKASLELEVPPEHSAMKALEEYFEKIKRGIPLKKLKLEGNNVK